MRSQAQSSAIMRGVRGKDTGPELVVRRMLHRLGYRYRLHRAGLPGRPDLVFPARRGVVFVHGCFWHSHGCAADRPPRSRADFWGPKLAATRARDARAIEALAASGWRVCVVWECELGDPLAVEARLRAFLDGYCSPSSGSSPPPIGVAGTSPA